MSKYDNYLKNNLDNMRKERKDIQEQLKSERQQKIIRRINQHKLDKNKLFGVETDN